METMKFVTSTVCMALCGAAVAAGLPTAENGVITIDGEVTVGDSEGAAALAAATGLVLNEGAVLTYTATDDLALSANVSGTGTFKADGSGKVTLSGDNSGLVAPGHFDFKNMRSGLVIANFNGLGGAATGQALVEQIGEHLTWLSFKSQNGVFTNNASLKITHGNNGNQSLKMGSDSSLSTLVFNNDLFIASSSSGENHWHVLNNIEVVRGTFTMNGHVRINSNDDNQGGATLKFLGDADVVLGTEYSQAIIYGSSLVTFSCASVTAKYGLAPDSSRNVRFVKANCLGADCNLSSYSNGEGTHFDFCGFDQEIGRLRLTTQGAVTPILKSEEPATVKAVDPTVRKEMASYKFTGALGYWHDTAQKLSTFAKSTSTGDLKVSQGTVAFVVSAQYSKSGGWSGKDVTVCGTGTLDCESPESLTGGNHVLTVCDSATLVIGAGVTLKVAQAQLGSVTLDPQTTYTVAELQALVADQGITISGEGMIETSARSIPGTWKGWPEAGTVKTVQVPDGADAVIADDDVEKVECLDTIETGAGATISVQTQAKTLTIKAKISGGAVVSAANTRPVVLLGDNSGLLAPGGFVFNQTVCVVSNEYGLGGAKTAAATFNCTDLNVGDIVFGGADGVLTNRAAIKIVSSKSGPKINFGSPSENDWLYQAADFTCTTAGGTTDFYFQNNCFFVAGTSRISGTFYLRSNGKGICGAAGDAVCEWGNNIIEYATNLRVGGRSFKATTAFAPGSDYNIVFTRDYCLGPNCVLKPYANGTGNGKWFDFNGTTQEVARILENAYNKSNHARLYSERPALVKTVGTAVGTNEMGLVFSGALSFWHDSPDVMRLAVTKSNSTGELIVSDGEIEFLEPTGWSGVNVTVGDGGSLVCTSTKSLEGGTHHLTVEPGGKLTVAAGVTLKVQEAAFGSVNLDHSRVYTAAEVRALIEGAGANVTLLGDGAIQTSAKSIPGTWGGWPEAGTATRVEIPDGATVTVTTDDLPKMLALAEIEMGQKSEIVVGDASATPIELTPNFLGAGKIRICGTDGNVTNVIVRGDNSGLISPGGFVFSNTWAVVASRHGLGSGKTDAAEFYPAEPFTSNLNRLTFTEEAKTNDVGLVFAMGCLCGYDTPGVPFVQTAGVKGGSQSYNSDVCRVGFFNDFSVVAGTFDCIFVRVHTSTSVLRLTGDCVVSALQGVYGTAGTIEIGPKAVDPAQFTLALEQSMKRAVFTKPEAFCMSKTGYLNFYDQSYTEFQIDLNGYDQTLAALSGNSYWNANQQALTITSAEPATLTLNGTTSRSVAVKCIDQASLTYAGTATQTVGCATSTSTGALTVNSGAVSLERNAKWTKGDVVLNGGELIVQANAATNTFGTGSARANLVVTGGKIRLLSDAVETKVKTITLNGKVLERGVYTKDNCDFVVGPGRLRAMQPSGLLLLVR